jgi:basic amino acid/polyamine antiporter, APA family
VATAASAVGWGANLNAFLVTTFNTTISPKLTTAPAEGGTLNLLAVVIVAAIAALLIKGVRETARTNNIMVAVKLTTLVFFVVAGLTAFVSGNFTPFAPNGLHGIVRAASLVFFAFLGFEAVAAGSEEVKNPRRDLPLAIIGALAIATLFYMVVSVTAIGLVPAHRLASSEAPLADALEHGTGLSWAASVTSGGATVAITSVLLGAFYTTTRIVFAMARDGLVPGAWARVNQTTGTPILLTLSLAALIGVAAALLSLTTLFQLVNIGTLSAFAAINFGVIVLRRTRPDLSRPFRVPFVPVFPLIGIAVCIYLMFQLPGTTWERWGVWSVVGLAIYGFFGYRNSRLRREPEAVEAGHPDLHQHR